MRFFPIFLLTLFLLAACTSEPVIKTNVFVPPKTPGVMMCTLQCGDARNYCRQSCDLHDRECVKDVQTQGMKDYDNYTREQFRTNQPIEFRPRDFERTAHCDDQKKECTDDCENHYVMCYKNCGGEVQSTSSCQFLCF